MKYEYVISIDETPLQRLSDAVRELNEFSKFYTSSVDLKKGMTGETDSAPFKDISEKLIELTSAVRNMDVEPEIFTNIKEVNKVQKTLVADVNKLSSGLEARLQAQTTEITNLITQSKFIFDHVFTSSEYSIFLYNKMENMVEGINQIREMVEKPPATDKISEEKIGYTYSNVIANFNRLVQIANNVESIKTKLENLEPPKAEISPMLLITAQNIKDNIVDINSSISGIKDSGINLLREIPTINRKLDLMYESIIGNKFDRIDTFFDEPRDISNLFQTISNTSNEIINHNITENVNKFESITNTINKKIVRLHTIINETREVSQKGYEQKPVTTSFFTTRVKDLEDKVDANVVLMQNNFDGFAKAVVPLLEGLTKSNKQIVKVTNTIKSNI